MSKLSTLRKWQTVLESGFNAYGFNAYNMGTLVAAIQGAAAVAPPDGSPDAIDAQSSACLEASSTCTRVADDLDHVARNELPAAWRGDVAETASQAVSGLAAEAAAAGSALSQAGQALADWADNLRNAQRRDRSGRDSLQSALTSIETSVLVVSPAAVKEALAGVTARIAAASLADTSGKAAAAALNQLTDQARAERVDAGRLDPVDAVVLATELNAAADGGGNILTAAELSRASDLMNQMSAADLAEFENLLASAESPAEAAFLMKALAAGNSLTGIQRFDALIHRYGNDTVWLSEHLAPDLGDDSYQGGGSPGNTVYAQGPVNDCVAASSVVALANLDPVFMLKLTTGNHPGATGSDDAGTFETRLQNSYTSQYQQGQRADGVGADQLYPKTDGGLFPRGQTLLANSDLGKATGLTYHYVSLNGSSANQAALPTIEKAVDSGQPVPIDVTDHNGDNHQMVIIGASGDRLEVYNPWGFTGWVSTQQFVSNQLGSLTNSGPVMPAVYAAELPS